MPEIGCCIALGGVCTDHQGSSRPGAAIKTISPLVLTWHIFRQTAVELMISDQTRVFVMPNQLSEEERGDHNDISTEMC